MGSKMCKDFSDCSQKSLADWPDFLGEDPERRAMDGVRGDNSVSFAHSLIYRSLYFIYASIHHLFIVPSVSHLCTHTAFCNLETLLNSCYVPGTGDPGVKTTETLTSQSLLLGCVGGVKGGT